ncbi:MAG: ATP-binding protein [Candidatus Tectomicrobia bacterium]|uniref:ATP-binding protein n=1 Tax=Tectimicrobiota bacterium TaxID=2528274 RepID=A0A932MND3_UNCTE|nr:ATP-binding protein [Candidatus Tectomicrobia bacterium]
MDDLYECRTALGYVRNLLRTLPDLSSPMSEILDETLSHIQEACPSHRRRSLAPLPGRKEAGSLEELVRLLDGWLGNLRASLPSPLQQNLEVLADALGLDGLEAEILGLGVRAEASPAVLALCSGLKYRCGTEAPRMLALLLDARPGDVGRRLEPEAALVRTGLLRLGAFYKPSGYGIDLDVLPRVSHALLSPSGGYADLLRRLLGEVARTHLAWEDFGHLAEERDLAARLLHGALESRARGVHVLLHGPTGTGKTELCKVIAHHLKIDLYSIGEKSEAEEEYNRSGRIGAFQLAQRLLQSPRAALLFDEMEDLFEGGLELASPLLGPSRLRRSHAGSKVFIHRLLEEAPVPTLWTTNSLAALDPAVVRRMSLVIELKAPSRGVRERIWRRHLAERGLDLPPGEVSALAREADVPPGVVAKAVEAAGLTGDPRSLRLTALSLARALRGKSLPPRRAPQEAPFDPGLLNADPDLRGIPAGWKGGSFSLCLYGPPGTGKSACARHLAERLGLEVLEKRASDLLSMWVGEAEKNIARAFEEAREEGAFLLLDEADSLLGDRRLALRSWEVTQVNEMLARMEAHALPFACTTNLVERLDPASLRRFTLKVRFGYLDPDQARRAFSLYLGCEAPRELAALARLTPGDFAAVRRRAEVLGGLGDPAELLRMLAHECALKAGPARAIGFA